jgi:hypothetical protein
MPAIALSSNDAGGLRFTLKDMVAKAWRPKVGDFVMFAPYPSPTGTRPLTHQVFRRTWEDRSLMFHG